MYRFVFDFVVGRSLVSSSVILVCGPRQKGSERTIPRLTSPETKYEMIVKESLVLLFAPLSCFLH